MLTFFIILCIPFLPVSLPILIILCVIKGNKNKDKEIVQVPPTKPISQTFQPINQPIKRKTVSYICNYCGNKQNASGKCTCCGARVDEKIEIIEE